jgi:hypothetical protein
MKKKNSLILDDEFIQYCQINNIEDIDKLARETFNRGFTILKYGEIPSIVNNKKEIIKEVEVIKEVPVEKIVEIVKEVPIREEIIIEKDNNEMSKLIEENNKLKQEIEKITKSLDVLNQAKYMKNSNLNSLYGE